MNQIVESKLFTDEQKVSIIKAVLDEKITIDANSTFEKQGDYYFIMINKGYNYAMTFTDGFKYMYLGCDNIEFIQNFVSVSFPLENSAICYSGKKIVTYNKENAFPFVYYEKGVNWRYFVEATSENTEFIKNIIKHKNIVRDMMMFEFITFATQNEIETVPPIDNLAQITFNGSDFVFRYTDNSYSTIYKTKISKNPPQPEKDKFMIAVDGFADSETLKKTITVKKIDMFKQRVIDYISKAIENNEKYIEMYKSETYSTPEITEFLKYICDTKKYTITTTSGYFRIEFY